MLQKIQKKYEHRFLPCDQFETLSGWIRGQEHSQNKLFWWPTAGGQTVGHPYVEGKGLQ